jgi:hypothetical protein
MYEQFQVLSTDPYVGMHIETRESTELPRYLQFKITLAIRDSSKSPRKFIEIHIQPCQRHGAIRSTETILGVKGMCS